MTKREFEELVGVEVNKHPGKISYIKAVYVVLDRCLKDELANSGVSLACGKGCAVCCRQMISCTKGEVDEIILFINGIKDKKNRRALKHKLENFADGWEDYRSQQPSQDAFLRNPFKFVEDWMGKPCPFLGTDGACIIYPVRIIDCRTMSSVKKCEDFETSGAKRLRFDCEILANNLILEHQEDRFGYQAVVPLGQWLLLFKQNHWQPIEDEALIIRR